MRMAADQFVCYMPGNFFEVERPALLGQLAVKNYLQQQVAQFLGQLVIVTRLNGVH